MGFRPFDDTYITFRYALNLASGFGFVYNAGERVLGTTTPLWTLLLALMQRAHIPMEAGALVLPLCLDVVTALLLFRLLIALQYSGAVATGAAVFFLSWFDYFSIARSGMEAPLFVFCSVAAIHSLASQRFTRGAAFCALAWLTRPEGALLAALLILALWQRRSSLGRNELVAPLALFCAMCGAWALFAIHTFGSVIPQSVIAKASTAARPDLVRFSWANLALFFARGQYGGDIFSRTYLQLMPVVTMLAGAAAASIVLGARRRSVDRQRATWLLAFPVAYVTALAFGHAFTYFPWYYAPIYPFAAALAAVGAGVVWRERQGMVIGTCAVLAVAQLAAAAFVKLPADRDFWVTGYFAVSNDVPRRPDVKVAAPEIGAVGWRVWPATVLDLEGLVTPAAVGRAPEDYIEEMEPQYVILRTDNASEFLQRAQQGGKFFKEYALTAAKKDPYADREFQAYTRR